MFEVLRGRSEDLRVLCEVELHLLLLVSPDGVLDEVPLLEVFIADLEKQELDT